jgi:hypothetical protein
MVSLANNSLDGSLYGEKNTDIAEKGLDSYKIHKFYEKREKRKNVISRSAEIAHFQAVCEIRVCLRD